MTLLSTTTVVKSEDQKLLKYRLNPETRYAKFPCMNQTIISTAQVTPFGFSFIVFLQRMAASSTSDAAQYDYEDGNVVAERVTVEIGVIVSWDMNGVREHDGKNVHIYGSMSYKRIVGESGPTRSETKRYSMIVKASPAFPNPSRSATAIHTFTNVLTPLNHQVSAFSLWVNIVHVGPTATSIDRSMTVPPALGFVVLLNDPTVCDCSFLAKDASVPLYASRTMLTRSSPFFRAMFSGEWAETCTKGEPINVISWDVAAVVLVFVHIYSGWLPGSMLPKGAEKVVRDFKCDPETIEFASWHNMLELARMLELKALTLGINRHLVTLLDVQFKELAAAEPTCGVH
ncbi:hypothetical protein AMAG_15184 [Allomyces macrogynus ATCC 38327]|uniref:BTB domain-containing protein n=1 Tax=Allomyces macrogynus (strain ATCC 38327) TaxID=578462 RepID=A0A0L0T635_ALLM3|nr:hypothetical protein AMAG_15184 [Allomyces macrogynus ATCC 38327]|eukprot:KNE70215.1 hypothetical protein AMAG_15184 [Allomyces macrogynus ATCC 38327]